jgi:S1/P1 Nuclease
MKLFPRSLAIAALTLVLASPAYPWGEQGHKAMALAASHGLNADARAHVVKILGTDDLSTIATYMDQLREVYFHKGPLADDPEAHRLNALFPHNNEWHYADLPLGTMAYKLDDPGVSTTDVVHMEEMAIEVLEGRGDARLNKADALRMLVHFVGDMHQPLHVGNGFFSFSADGTATLVKDPAAAKDLENDKGGNDLFYGPNKFDELHALWDFSLPEKILNTRDVPALAARLEKDIAEKGASWAQNGDYHHWAESWATESLATARKAYDGISYGAVTRDEKGALKKIAITLPEGYEANCLPLVEERLAKSAFRLTQVLNAIHWAD